MTTTTRGLVVDDNPALAKRLVDILDLGFKALKWSVKWRSSETALGAIQLVQESPPFDFAIIDFELESGENGLSVVREIRAAKPSTCYILVITGETRRHPNFIELSKDAGADHAIIREQITLRSSAREGPDGWDAYSLARRIRKHRIVLKQAADGFAIDFAEDTGVQSMLHSLGDPPGEYHDAITRGQHIASSLILECLERDDDAGTTLRVEHLAPGRSGAHVCKVLRKQAGHPDESFVVKIGLDHAALKAEWKANQNAAYTLSPQVLVRLTGDLKTHSSSGYAALSAGLARDASTLRSWLCDPMTKTQQARGVAEELFGGHLVSLFQQNLRQRRDVTGWLEVSPVLRLRVHDALVTHAEVWRHEQGAHRRDAGELAALLRAFVDSGALPGTDARVLGREVVHIHAFGDLHSSNVMVQTVGQPRPVLVDASQYGVHHWATDATRLLVDLVLRVRRAGVESMLWSGVAGDCAYAEGLCHCSDPGGEPQEPVDAFIAQVVDERHRYLSLDDLEPREANWHWQWHVALAREFLRQGSRPGTLPTRAVVALTAAARHLTRAAEALRD